MAEKKNNLDKTINFRMTKNIYECMLQYLKFTGESISELMRKITYDYLKIKKFVEENGGIIEEITDKPKIVINAPPQGIL